jgi:hypothetical protein
MSLSRTGHTEGAEKSYISGGRLMYGQCEMRCVSRAEAFYIVTYPLLIFNFQLFFDNRRDCDNIHVL